MGQVDPACSQSSPFFMGQDSHGNWVVQDQTGDCGGIFVYRAAALKFAKFESGHRPNAVIMMPGVFELDMKRGADNVHSLPRHIGFSTIDGPLNGDTLGGSRFSRGPSRPSDGTLAS